MCRYRVNQHLASLVVLDSVTINKSSHGISYLVNFRETKSDVKYIDTVKSTTQQVHVFKSNRMFGTNSKRLLKLIANDHQIPNKRREYKILELKYGNIKLLGKTKYNQVKLVFAVFASAILYHVSIKLYLANLSQSVSNS